MYVGRPARGAAWLLAVLVAFAAWGLGAARSFDLFRGLSFPALFLVLGLIGDSAWLARRGRGAPRASGPWDRGWVYASVIAFSGFVLPWAASRVAPRLVGTATISDDGMAPDVLAYDLVVHDPRAFRHDGPRRGDAVVVVGADGAAAVRRVIALPGEAVEVRRGVARVGGVERVEDYRILGRRRDLFVPPATLGPAEWLVLSDLRSRDEASRCRVGRKDLLGRASWILLPGDFDPLRFGAPIR